MSFTDPGFETMSLDELKEWLGSNDLSAANYSELLNQLTVDLPTALPGVVQSSIGGSSGSVSPPSQGSTLEWDSGQQLYVPAAPGPQPGDLISSVAASRPGAIICQGQTVTGGVALYPNLAAACPQLVSGANLILPDFQGRLPLGAGTGTAVGATTWTLGQQPESGAGGEQTHTLVTGEIPVHSHGVNDPGHAHTQSQATVASGGVQIVGVSANGSGSAFNNGPTSSNGTGISVQNTGGGGAHNNMPPVSVVNWFIIY